MKKENKVLELLKRGKTVDELADSLDMREQTLRAMIEQLAHEGMLGDATCESGCNFCPYSGSCGGSSGREKLYVVDEEEGG
ncbi:MAG: FeoC-like transcriptional regulator [Candidatus Acetothermia bacterium]